VIARQRNLPVYSDALNFATKCGLSIVSRATLCGEDAGNAHAYLLAYFLHRLVKAPLEKDIQVLDAVDLNEVCQRILER